ncbi:MAG: alpha/beta fold hydrolase [Acetobacteraceae bacterium]
MLLSLNGRRIHYDLAGPDDGPTVCFTHSLAADGGMWAEQLSPLLEYGFRVLRLDMRGHGGSEPVPGSYSMSALAQDVADALTVLDIPRVHYVGLSIGGMIGQAFALDHAPALISAMWCDTLPSSPRWAKEGWDQRMGTVRQTGSLESLADATMERWFTDGFKSSAPGRWKQLRDTIAATTPDGYLGCCDAILDFDFSDRLPDVKLPVLVVCGADDLGTPALENRRIAELVPDARYEEIAEARHFPNVEQREAFNQVLLDWLDAQRDRH